MQCRSIKLPGGGTAIVCGRFPRAKPCSVCRVHVGNKLCDGRIPGCPRTCDAPLCACCAVTRPNPKKPGDTLDYCPRCAPNAPPEQLPLGGRP